MRKAKFVRVNLIATLLIVAGLPAMAWTLMDSVEDARKDATTAFLTSDAHVVVGSVPIRLPYAFLPDHQTSHESSYCLAGGARRSQCERLESFQLAANRPDTAPHVDVLKVAVKMGGWRDFNEVSADFCERFSAEWARSVCENPWMPLQQALPSSRFYLIDDRTMDASTAMRHFGPLEEDVRAMTVYADKATVTCGTLRSDPENKFCTAGQRLSDHLLAFWTVRKTSHETPMQMAERQGAAIKLFVEHATGHGGDYAAMMMAACKLRPPDLPDGPDRLNLCSVTRE